MVDAYTSVIRIFTVGWLTIYSHPLSSFSECYNCFKSLIDHLDSPHTLDFSVRTSQWLIWILQALMNHWVTHMKRLWLVWNKSGPYKPFSGPCNPPKRPKGASWWPCPNRRVTCMNPLAVIWTLNEDRMSHQQPHYLLAHTELHIIARMNPWWPMRTPLWPVRTPQWLSTY